MPNHVMVRSLCLGVSRVKQSAESGLFLYYSLGFVIAIITFKIDLPFEDALRRILKAKPAHKRTTKAKQRKTR